MAARPEEQLQAAREMLERHLLAGEGNAVERTLSAFAAVAEHEELVVELIYNDHLIREELGQSPQVQDYLDRFPDHAQRIQRLFRIHDSLSADESLPQLEFDSAALPRALGPGSTFGAFQVLSCLGAGGGGVVFKARQIDLDRFVALKILKSSVTSEREIKRFLAEAKAVANLQHPNVVQVYEADIQENLPYIALEYIGGGTLETKISSGPIAGKEAAKLLAILADAMQYAHDRGVVHRDLKPGNVLLTEAGIPKITDFGLAKRLDHAEPTAPQSITVTGAVLGTPSYMAPEQAEGRNREIGPLTDVYGLGAILYHLVTGQVPFVGESTIDVLQSICSMDPVAPSLVNPKVPRDLETICLKCLEKEPKHRYESAAALSEDLNRFLNGQPIIARPTGYVQRMIKLARRHPLPTALTAGLAGAIMVVFFLISWQWNQAALGERTQTRLRSAAEDALYSNQLALAHKEIKSSESRRALEVLDSTDPKRRHWEWKYLKQSCNTYTTLGTLGPDTRRCMLSPNGSLLAVVKGRWGTDEPGSMAVFDARTRKLLFEHETAFGPIMDAAFSPDGETIASVAIRFSKGEGLLTFHNSRTGESTSSLPKGDSGLFGICYHPSQPVVALACEDSSVEILDLESKQVIHRLIGHRDRCYRVAFSPTGTQLASCSGDGTVRLWNTESGTQEAVLRARKDLMNVAYTPDGRYVVANGYDQAIQYWDLLEQPPRPTKVHLAGDQPLSYDLSISPEGRYLFAFGDGGRRLYSYDMSVERISLRSAETLNRPFWLTHHPTEEQLYVVDADGNVLESNPRPANPFQRFVTASAAAINLEDQSNSIAIASGSSRALPGAHDFRCRLLSLSEPDAEIQFFEGAPTWVSSIALSPNGRTLACGCEDGSVLRWSVESGDLLDKSTVHDGKVIYLDFPSDGDRLISIDSNGLLAEWSGNSPSCTSTSSLGGMPLRIATASWDAKRLLSHDENGVTALYSIEKDAHLHSSEDSGQFTASKLWQIGERSADVRAMALSHDAQHVAMAHDHAVEMWSVSTNEQVPNWSTAMPLTSATAIAFHPDGRRLAVVDGRGGRVIILDAATGQALLELSVRSGTDRVQVTFSADGNRLIATVGGELYVWNAANQDAELASNSVLSPSKSQCRTDFQWHVNQASEQIYGGLPTGAEFHARQALEVYDRHREKLVGMPALDVLTLNARCHLAKSLIDLGQQELEKEKFKSIIAECPDQYRSLHTISLLLATYPGQAAVSPDQLVVLTNRALEFEPTDSNALATAGIAHLRRGDMDQARRLLEAAADDMESWDGLVLFPSAVIEARAGNPSEAARLFDRAVNWMESSASKQPIIRELHRWAAEAMNR